MLLVRFRHATRRETLVSPVSRCRLASAQLTNEGSCTDLTYLCKRILAVPKNFFRNSFRAVCRALRRRAVMFSRFARRANKQTARCVAACRAASASRSKSISRRPRAQCRDADCKTACNDSRFRGPRDAAAHFAVRYAALRFHSFFLSRSLRDRPSRLVQVHSCVVAPFRVCFRCSSDPGVPHRPAVGVR